MPQLSTRKSSRLSKSPAPALTKAKRGASAALKKKQTAPAPKPAQNKRNAKAKATTPPTTSAKASSKMVFVTKKASGGAVDPHMVGGSSYRVLVAGGEVYNRNLMKSNVERNNNKVSWSHRQYYIAQLLEEDKANPSNTIIFFTRWGRVGEVNGIQRKVSKEQQIIQAYPKDVAIRQFQKKVRAKCSGGYREIQTCMDADDQEDKKQSGKKSAGAASKSKLAPKVKSLMELIFDDKILDNTLKQIGYDAKKMPLGKLSEEIINEGYDILNQISKVIDKKSKGDLKKLSSAFYSCIPHDFGRKHMSNFIITTAKDVQTKIEVLDTLKNMSVASRIIQKGRGAATHPLDSNYEQLKTAIKALEPASDRFKLLKTYFENTKKGHWGTQNLKDIFEIEREGEEKRFKSGGGSLKNHMLLWHGSRVSNFGGILKQGLRIAPPEAPASGYNFGKGLYFADMAAKSLGYSYSDKSGSDLLIMLAEVALGEPNIKLNFDFNAAKLPKGKHSTYGVGSTAPPSNSIKTIEKGVKVPLGQGKPNPKGKNLGYSEFIVYDVSQVKLRYLLRYSDK